MSWPQQPHTRHPGEGRGPIVLRNRTTHVLAAAQRRFNLPVAVGAFGYLDFGAIIELEGAVNERSVAFAAGSVDRHPAFGAFISCHLVSFLKWISFLDK